MNKLVTTYLFLQQEKNKSIFANLLQIMALIS